jgi:hypothetical protein
MLSEGGEMSTAAPMLNFTRFLGPIRTAMQVIRIRIMIAAIVHQILLMQVC